MRHRAERADDLRDAEVDDEEHEYDDGGEERHVHHASPVPVVEAKSNHLPKKQGRVSEENVL